MVAFQGLTGAPAMVAIDGFEAATRRSAAKVGKISGTDRKQQSASRHGIVHRQPSQ
jgi:hypothetical protein